MSTNKNSSPTNSTLNSEKSFGSSALLVSAALVVTLAGVAYISDVFAPFFFALTLVLSVMPINRWLMRHHVPVMISTLLTLLFLFITLLGLAALLALSMWEIPIIISGYQGQIAHIYVDTVNNLSNLADKFHMDLSPITNFAQNINLTRIIDTLTSALSQLSSFGYMMVTLLLSILFLVMDMAVTGKTTPLVKGEPSGIGPAMLGFERSVRQYWIVSSVFGLIVAAFDVVALWFLGIPGALAWGVIAFVTNYIPNIGFVIGVIPPAFIGLLEGGWWTMGAVLISYMSINFVIQWVIQPKFTGNAVGLNTTVTFLSLLVWSMLVGPLGAILAVPITLFFKALLVDSDPRAAWLNRYLQSPSTFKQYAETIGTAADSGPISDQEAAQAASVAAGGGHFSGQRTLLEELGFQWSPHPTGAVKERFKTSEIRLRVRNRENTGKVASKPNRGQRSEQPEISSKNSGAQEKPGEISASEIPPSFTPKSKIESQHKWPGAQPPKEK